MRSIPTLDRRASRALLLAVVGLNFVLAIYTHHVTLRGFPNSGDEYAQYVSAQIFAEGRLSVPSPKPRKFFHFHHIVNDGKFYGKYAPGWPVLLAAGVRVGLPSLVNPVLLCLTLIWLYEIARENYSSEIANVALVLAAANPYLIFNSASYFPHPAGLLFATAAILSFYRCLAAPLAFRHALALGASTGALFLVRPFTAIALLAPFGAWLLVVSLRSSQRVRIFVRLAAGTVPIFAAVGAFLLYNQLQTGDPLLQPFNHYDPHDTLGRTPSSKDYAWALRENLLGRLRDLNNWLPISVLLLLLHVGWNRTAQARKANLLLVGVTALLAGYFFYLFDPGNEYGPRYLYAGATMILLLMAGVLTRAGRLGPVLLAFAVIWNGGSMVSRSLQFSRQVEKRTEPYELARAHGLSNAILFLRTGSGGMPAKDLTRNGIHFDGPVLYVLDRGEKNAEMVEAHPDRGVYYFEYDESTERGRLTSR